MKALSIKQPWVNLIAAGLKTIEVRSWKTNYRGNLLICSSRIAEKNSELSQQVLETLFEKKLYNYHLGYAICIVELLDCRIMLPEDLPDAFVNGKYAWEFGNIRQLKPFPVTGKLSFFNVDDKFIEVV